MEKMPLKTYDELLEELGVPKELEDADDIILCLDKMLSYKEEQMDKAILKNDENGAKWHARQIEKISKVLEETKRLSKGLVQDVQSAEEGLEGQNGKESRDEQKQKNVIEESFQSQMHRAEMELKNQDWEEAKRLYDEVLDTEPENAEANLGMFMAKKNISGKERIFEAIGDAIAKKAEPDFFCDGYYQRTLRYADDDLRKDLKGYETWRDYLKAVEAFVRAEKKEKGVTYQKAARKWQGVAEEFAKLGDYNDAKERQKEATYRRADNMFKDARTIDGFLAVRRIYESLGSYKEAEEKKMHCDKQCKRIKQEQESRENYGREWEGFVAQYNNIPEIRAHELNIQQMQDERKKLIHKNHTGDFGWEWVLGISFLGLILFLIPVIGDAEAEATLAAFICGIAIFVVLVDHFGFFMSIVIILAAAPLVGFIFTYLLIALLEGIVSCFGNQMAIISNIGSVALVVSVLLAIKKIMWKIAVKSRKPMIMQLEQDIDEEFCEISKAIYSEYQKIYNKYKQAGSVRRKIRDVQAQLIADSKKRLEWEK